jgi:hypothetical protein
VAFDLLRRFTAKDGIGDATFSTDAERFQNTLDEQEYDLGRSFSDATLFPAEKHHTCRLEETK